MTCLTKNIFTFTASHVIVVILYLSADTTKVPT